MNRAVELKYENEQSTTAGVNSGVTEETLEY